MLCATQGGLYTTRLSVRSHVFERYQHTSRCERAADAALKVRLSVVLYLWDNQENAKSADTQHKTVSLSPARTMVGIVCWYWYPLIQVSGALSRRIFYFPCGTCRQEASATVCEFTLALLGGLGAR